MEKIKTMIGTDGIPYCSVTCPRRVANECGPGDRDHICRPEISNLLAALTAAREERDRFERDWIDAKAEFGQQMTEANKRVDAAIAQAEKAERERDEWHGASIRWAAEFGKAKCERDWLVEMVGGLDELLGKPSDPKFYKVQCRYLKGELEQARGKLERVREWLETRNLWHRHNDGFTTCGAELEAILDD